MSSPGIDRWVQDAPSSWAKFAKGKSKNMTFEQFKKKFLDGAESENKGYLKKYLDDSQLRHIYENGVGGEKRPVGSDVVHVPMKPTQIVVLRNNKLYSRQSSPRWELKTKFVLSLAAKEKPKSKKYEELVNILVKEGRTRQAVTKKIQRVRRETKPSTL